MEVLEDTFVAAVEGDRRALGELLEAAYGPLEESLSGSIGAPFRASISPEDVIQVTYLEAFLRIGQLRARSQSAFLAWLKRIAENNVRDAVRELEAKKRPSPRHRLGPGPSAESYASLLACLSGTGTTPTGHACREDIRNAVESALTALPPVYEAVVRGYDLEGKTISQVAQAVKKSPAAVHMLRARAHDRLRDLLRDAGRFFTGSM
jgi:RNA polymerase sigma-70 factor (ECF subfamily)